MTPIPPLPRRTRARLWWQRHIDALAIRLIKNGHTAAAERLWRALGMWK